MALAEGELSARHPSHFTTGESAPDTHWIGRWVSPRTGLDDIKRRKKFNPSQDLNSALLANQPAACRYTNCAIPVPYYMV
jgi:hypothetical protein